MTCLKNSLCLLFLLGIALLLSDILSGCATMYDGEKLFYSVGCSTCHTVNGKGGSIGPDLSGVTNVRSESWIVNFIHNPKKVKPEARMPAFKHLSRAKREAIVAFLKK